MKPTVPAALRTLKASLEEHVIPELESGFARGQAGQIALTLEWLAAGWVEPLQQLRDDNRAIRGSLTAIRDALKDLTASDTERKLHWSTARARLIEVLELSIEDTVEAQQADRDRLSTLLDDMVAAAGAPADAQRQTEPLWRALLSALEVLAAEETPYGQIPLPEEHWER